MSEHFCIRGRRLLADPTRPPAPGVVEIRDGKIVGFSPSASLKTIDAGNAIVMAGIVDTHAHINEPGRTDWEGFETATRAAAAGGITTIVDMPLNSIPPTTTLANLKEKSHAAEGKCAVDYGLWGGVIPGNLAELEPMIKAGIWGFKAFMIESGVDEFPMADEKVLREAMKVLAKHRVPLLVHAELCEREVAPPGDPCTYRHYLASRPAKWEVDAIRLIISLVRETRCPAHIVHLSAAEALEEIAKARRERLPLTVETCPHYLTLDSASIPDGATHFKCAPPIREAANQDRLWKALADGDIDTIVSDHSPCIPKLKQTNGDFAKAWGGIAGLQFSLSVVWTEMRRRGIPVEKLSGWMSERTARIAGLKKGTLAPGRDADLVVWDPDSSFALKPEKIYHRHSVTPYAEKTLFGVVHRTFVRGICVFEDGKFPAKPVGRELRREK